MFIFCVYINCFFTPNIVFLFDFSIKSQRIEYDAHKKL